MAGLRRSAKCAYWCRHCSSERATLCADLPQQEPKQRIALLTDVAQPPAVGTGVLTGNQSQIAGHLFAATKPSRGTKDQHKGQRRDRPHARMGLQPLHLRHPRSFFLDRLAQLIDARVEAVQGVEEKLCLRKQQPALWKL